MIRHKLITTIAGGAACDCGYDPRIVLEETFDWADAARAVLVHIKKSRHWEYLGLEFHYGVGYYIWENELTKQRYAMQEGKYLALTGVSRSPRLEIRWTA